MLTQTEFTATADLSAYLPRAETLLETLQETYPHADVIKVHIEGGGVDAGSYEEVDHREVKLRIAQGDVYELDCIVTPYGCPRGSFRLNDHVWELNRTSAEIEPETHCYFDALVDGSSDTNPSPRETIEWIVASTHGQNPWEALPSGEMRIVRDGYSFDIEHRMFDGFRQ